MSDTTPPPRKVALQATNRRGRPVLGVTYEVFANGRRVLCAVKTKTTPQRVEVPWQAGDVLRVTAALPGQPMQEVELSSSASRWTFNFVGAGMPSVLIVCALAKETRAVLETFDAHVRDSISAPRDDPNHYYVGEYRNPARDGAPRSVLVATSGMGTTNAAITALHALRSFPDDIEQILMVGIAGGCPNHQKAEDHVRLGDIVVASARGLIQYDFIKRTVDGDEHRASLQRPSKEMLNADSTLEIGRLRGERPWEALMAGATSRSPDLARPAEEEDQLFEQGVKVAHPKDVERQPGTPRIHRGAIGTANILLKDPKQRDSVRDRFGVRAIEMEGSGVLDAGWSMNRDVMVVRGICDYCDDKKNDVWQQYAALAAAAYARCLIEALPDRMFA